MNNTFVKVVVEPHANRQLQNNVVSSLAVYGIYTIGTKMKDTEVTQEENMVESGKTYSMWWSFSCDL